MLSELNPLKNAFWQRLGKFLKRLGPVVPIASWACYLFPSIATGSSLLVFYAIFVIVTGYFCFLLPRSLEEKLAGQIYCPGSRQNRIKGVYLFLDAFFMGLITFSLACLMAIMVFRVHAAPLYEVLQSKNMNLPTTIISILSVVITISRYQQKKHSLRLKMYAYDLRKSSITTQTERLNGKISSLLQIRHRITRVVSDCLVVFYNIFFVGVSLAMLFFSNQINTLLQAYFVWKMIGISGLITAKIAHANHKGSGDYLCHKVAQIASVHWQSSHLRFFDSPCALNNDKIQNDCNI